MKHIVFLIILLSTKFMVFAQSNNDTIYASFTKCIYGYFLNKDNEHNNDSVIGIFENNPVILHTSYPEGGVYHSILKISNRDSLKVDNSHSKKSVFFDRRSGFPEFLNFILSSDYGSAPKFSNLTGTWAYVYAPGEEWQQFFLDQLIGYDSLYLHPVIDAFSFKKDFVTHNRYRLRCLFVKNTGFKIEETLLIRNRKIKTGE